jgi:uncharacterized protein involved in exopolysaccharide biosynthesis
MLNKTPEATKQAVLVFVDEAASGESGASAGVMRILRQYWILIGCCALVAGVAAVTYSLLAPKWYRAQATLAPVQAEAGLSALGPIGGQVSGLASLVGLDIGGDSDEKKQVLARLSSRQFNYDFLRTEGLIPILFANKWDAQAQRWKSGKAPTLEDSYRYFVDNVVTVSEDRRTNLVKVTVDWKDPKLAQDWANKLVARINADRRAVARSDAERNLEFLNRELERTTIVELRQAINRLVETETRKLMLANVHEDYAFKVIDPAYLPERSAIVRPRVALLTATAILLGALFGACIALIRWNRQAR